MSKSDKKTVAHTAFKENDKVIGLTGVDKENATTVSRDRGGGERMHPPSVM